MANQTDVERLKDLTHIVSTLIEGNYVFTGIKYRYISCGSHILIHRFRGVEVKMDKYDLECIGKGIKKNLDVFAYYNNRCYQLLFD